LSISKHGGGVGLAICTVKYDSFRSIRQTSRAQYGNGTENKEMTAGSIATVGQEAIADLPVSKNKGDI
jgi:hypothetical protein